MFIDHQKTTTMNMNIRNCYNHEKYVRISKLFIFALTLFYEYSTFWSGISLTLAYFQKIKYADYERSANDVVEGT